MPINHSQVITATVLSAGTHTCGAKALALGGAPSAEMNNLGLIGLIRVGAGLSEGSSPCQGGAITLSLQLQAQPMWLRTFCLHFMLSV